MKIGEWLTINEKRKVKNHFSEKEYKFILHVFFEFFTYPFILAFNKDERNENKLEFILRFLWLRINYRVNGWNINLNSPFATSFKYIILGK